MKTLKLNSAPVNTPKNVTVKSVTLSPMKAKEQQPDKVKPVKAAKVAQPKATTPKAPTKKVVAKVKPIKVEALPVQEVKPVEPVVVEPVKTSSVKPSNNAGKAIKTQSKTKTQPAKKQQPTKAKKVVEVASVPTDPTENKLNMSIAQLLDIITTNTKIGDKQKERLTNQLITINEAGDLFTDKITLTRTLCSMGLPVKTVAFIVSMDSAKVGVNNMKRVGLGDKSNMTLEKLVIDPRYKKELTKEQFEQLKTMHPNAGYFESHIVQGGQKMDKRELQRLTDELIGY